MPIDMDSFGSEGLYPRIDALPVSVSPALLFCVQCHFCGFEVEEVVEIPRYVCPKCHSGAWERFTRPGSTLRVADARGLDGTGNPQDGLESRVDPVSENWAQNIVSD
jgi:hypothetical protein